MSVPANVIADLNNLQAQVVANTPVTNASHATVVAMQLNAAQLVSDAQTALTTPGNILDTFSQPWDVSLLIAGINTIVQASEDQYNLAMIRAVAGRVASNLDQL